MRHCLPLIALLAVCLGASQADAKSCSSFAKIKSFDAAANTVEVEHEKGKIRKFFPRPEGTPADSTKVPKPCRGNEARETTLVVSATGGRLTITQVRSNFEGKMMNDANDAAWLPNQLNKLIADGTTVVIVVREGMGKDAPLGISTVYLPITDEELAEIKRLEAQAEDA